MDFTPDQRNAIAAPANVLVMAGAGTGKTRTLVEHCVRRLLSNEASIDQVLMLTFTEAAAAEMRERVALRLREKLAEDPANPLIHEQLALLETARISTLHSYCYKLVREYFDELGRDPRTSVLTEDQAKVLQMESFDDLRDHYYSEDIEIAAKVREFIELNAPSGEKKLRSIVEAIHAFTQARSHPRQWIDDQSKLHQAAEPSHWNDWLAEGLSNWACFWFDCLRSEPAYNSNARNCAKIVAQLRENRANRTPTEMRTLLDAIIAQDEVWPPKKKGICRDPIAKLFPEAKFLASLIPDGGKDPLCEDWIWGQGNTLTLLTVASEFARVYETKKRAMAVVDFHDLEQLALELLWDGTGKPSPSAREIASNLKWIYVDEYQDINHAQDRILRALHQPHVNLFMVGDVKQSIYRFRQAAPEIFQNYVKAWQSDPARGSVVFLSANFRSTPQILDFSNRFFARVMHEKLGGVAFDARAHLTCGRPPDNAPIAPEGRTSKVEVLLQIRTKSKGSEHNASNGGETESDDLDLNEQEAVVIAQRLRELYDSKYEVTDESGNSRPFTWGDAVILLRAPRAKVESYAKIFEGAAIPLQARRVGFFASLEVFDLTNVLNLLDNPLQDVPLLSVLRSPMAGLSISDLAQIRINAGRDAILWHAVQKYHREKNDSELWRALDCFLERYHRWQELSRHASLRERLQTIITETHYAEWLLIQPRGRQRLANVEQLLAIAGEFDAIQQQGIYHFVRFLEDQEDAIGDIEPAGVEDQNAVRLMSIHQSKGLEFPVVVVADLGKQFNLRGENGGIALTDRFGFATQVRPPGKRNFYDSLPAWLARRAEREQSIGEELRVLYVAITRAKQKLILAGTASRKAVQAWEEECAEPLAYHRIGRSTNALDWIGRWLSQVRPNWHESAPETSDSWYWQARTEIPEASESLNSLMNANAAETLLKMDLPSIVSRIEQKYPFELETLRRAKTSVSALRRQLAPDPDAEEKAFVSEPLRPFRARIEKEVTAVQTGAATHLLLQYLRLESAETPGWLKGEAARLVRDKLLSQDELEAIDLDAIGAFWISAVGKRFLAQSENLRRELPFTLRIAPESIDALQVNGGNSRTEDFVLVQGVIDLAMIRPGEIWLLDFKTDRVKTPELQERIASYRPQLEIYKMALEKIYHRPVTNTWLHFLSLRKTIIL